MEKLTNDLRENVSHLQGLLKDCDDIVFREIEIGGKNKIKIIIIFVDGLANKEFLSDATIQALFWKDDLNTFKTEESYNNLFDKILMEAIASAEIKKEDKIDEIINNLLSGDTILLMESVDRCLVIGTRDGPSRSIDEPKTESVIRGPRDGFTEILKTNTVLIRRRIKDTRFKIKLKKIGRRSQTAVAVLYIDDIVDKNLLKEVYKRLDDIDIDAILDSSILENLIEDNYLSPFPQVESTERPDSIAASLYEGRVGIIVDGSPFVLLVPATIGTLLQSTEDYYTRWTEASFVRLIRILSVFLAVVSPALYISITAYHPGLLPTKLIYYLAASRINVPFPSVVEATIMEITMELLREAGTRISGPIGTTVGIVGGLIIGQAAVEAGIVSPLMIIIVAVTSIATFTIPSYELSAALRLIKFTLIIFAGILGLYGTMIGLIILISHLLVQNSFGVPYTSPYSGLGVKEGDLKDTLVRVPVQRLWLRPGFTNPQNKRRMRLKKDE